MPERGEAAPLHSANGVEALSALNTASLRDAAAVCAGAEANASVVHAVFVATTAANDGASAERADTSLSSPRLLVSVEEGAALQLLQTHLTLTSDVNLGRHLTNSVTQVSRDPPSPHHLDLVPVRVDRVLTVRRGVKRSHLIYFYVLVSKCNLDMQQK